MYNPMFRFIGGSRHGEFHVVKNAVRMITVRDGKTAEEQKSAAASPHPFRPGDTVVCVDDTDSRLRLGADAEEGITKGREYEIEDVKTILGAPVVRLKGVVDPRGETLWWSSKRFKLASPAKSNHAAPKGVSAAPELRPGCLVECLNAEETGGDLREREVCHVVDVKKVNNLEVVKVAPYGHEADPIPVYYSPRRFKRITIKPGSGRDARPGDRVVCTDATAHSVTLTRGKIYTVSDRGLSFVEIENDMGKMHTYLDYRFSIVEDEDPAEAEEEAEEEAAKEASGETWTEPAEPETYVRQKVRFSDGIVTYEEEVYALVGMDEAEVQEEFLKQELAFNHRIVGHINTKRVIRENPTDRISRITYDEANKVLDVTYNYSWNTRRIFDVEYSDIVGLLIPESMDDAVDALVGEKNSVLLYR